MADTTFIHPVMSYLIIEVTSKLINELKNVASCAFQFLKIDLLSHFHKTYLISSELDKLQQSQVIPFLSDFLLKIEHKEETCGHLFLTNMNEIRKCG